MCCEHLSHYENLLNQLLTKTLYFYLQSDGYRVTQNIMKLGKCLIVLT